jgi:rod shape-determining protein MreB
MLSFLRSLVSSGPIYVRIARKRLSVKDVTTGKQFDDIPALALRRSKRYEVIAAVGQKAVHAFNSSQQDTRVVNAFDHPRIIVHDFIVAEKTLQYFFQEIRSNRIFRLAPVVIMHVTEPPDGGLTSIEVRVLQELAASVGARMVGVWDGRELSDHEISTGSYPGDHWLVHP